MIVENVPIELFSKKRSVTAFSDDSLFIYMASIENGFFEILVYDAIKNKCKRLLPDKTVTNAFNQTEDFDLKLSFSRPRIQTVDYNTLLILFHDNFFKISEDNGFALLIFVKLNDDKNTISLLDSIFYKDCFSAKLLKDNHQHIPDNHQFAITHSFSIDKDQYLNDQFFGCYILKVVGTRICQEHQERIKIGYNYGDRTPENLHLFENKIWFYRDSGAGLFEPHKPPGAWSELNKMPIPDRNPDKQLSYIDLTNSSKKETKVMMIEDPHENTVFWVKNFLVIYDNKSSEFSILDTKSKIWLKIESSSEFRDFKTDDSKFLEVFRTHRNNLTECKCFVDVSFNVTVIDEATYRLLRYPLSIPQSFKL